MPVPMSDLKLEYAALKPEIDAAIQRVVESGQFQGGSEVALFEQEYASYCGVNFGVGTGSGTSALQLALVAIELNPGDEVITVPNSDIATTMVVSHLGATIVWVDVDRKTQNIDPALIEERITAQTKAIIPVHLFGHPADMDPIMDIARRHNLLVVEDACLAAGAEYNGQKVGSIGNLGCFSFSPTKILGAYGDGGIVVTSIEDLAAKVRLYGDYGHEQHPPRKTGDRTPIAIKRRLVEGYNERLDALQAAILQAKLPTIETRIAARRRIANRYTEQLKHLDLETPHEAPNVRHVYRAYTILLEHRDTVRESLAKSGIDTQIYYAPPLHLEPAYAHLGYTEGAFPTSEEISKRMLHLPIFPEMTDDQVDEVVEALAKQVPVSTTTSTLN